MLNFEKALSTLVNNLSEVTVVVGEGKDKKSVTYLDPTSEARQVIKDVKDWEGYGEAEQGVKYAAKYNAEQDGYDFGPFDTLVELSSVIGAELTVAVFELYETTGGKRYPSKFVGTCVGGTWVPIEEV